MKRILYAGGSFITGDDIADAVFEYAAELANAGRSAMLEVPSLDLEQQPDRVGLVIGPASQLMSESVAAEREMADEVFTAILQRKTRVLQSKSGTADGDDAAYEALEAM